MGTPDENRAVIERAFTAYNAGDVHGYVGCYAARVRGRDLYSEGAWQTNAEVLAETETFRRSFPDRRCETDTIVAGGDRVVVHHMSLATHAKTGKAVAWACSSTYRIEDGAIVEVIVMNDTFGLLTASGSSCGRHAARRPPNRTARPPERVTRSSTRIRPLAPDNRRSPLPGGPGLILEAVPLVRAPARLTQQRQDLTAVVSVVDDAVHEQVRGMRLV